jgi:hypothetical protein
MSPKIPCLILAFYDLESVASTLRSLAVHQDRLEIMVVENRSARTDTELKPFISRLLDSGTVSRYFLFDRNITNNALETVLECGEVDLESSPFVLLTDGDLFVREPGWLDEEIRVLEIHDDVFACAITLSLDNLPVDTFPDAPTWVGQTRGETEDYVEAATGCHLTLFRSHELRAFLSYRQRLGRKVTDQNLREFAYTMLKKKWVRTRVHVARHLTWDRYRDLSDPYTQLKTGKSFRQTWYHDRYCGFRIYSSDGVKRRVPVRKILRGLAQRYRTQITNVSSRIYKRLRVP